MAGHKMYFPSQVFHLSMLLFLIGFRLCACSKSLQKQSLRTNFVRGGYKKNKAVQSFLFGCFIKTHSGLNILAERKC